MFQKTDQASHFESLVNFIKARTPEISIPWMKLWREQLDSSVHEEVPVEEKDLQDPKSDQASEDDFDTESEDKTRETRSAVTCAGNRSKEFTSGGTVLTDGETTAKIGQKRRIHPKPGHISKKMKLENITLEYQEPNIKTLMIEGKKKKKKGQA